MTTDHPFSLFTSSKMTELADERRAVQAVLSRLPNFCCWLWEDNAGARPEPIRSTYLAEVEACDVYIGLFWKEYGPYTIEEFNHARLHRKPCLIYEKHIDVGQRSPYLAEFLESIQHMEDPDTLTVCQFTTPEALAERVKNDVLRLLFMTFRQKHLFLQEPVVSQVRLEELKLLLQNIKVSQEKLVSIYHQSAPPYWPIPQENDEVKILMLMLERLTQARWKDGRLPHYQVCPTIGSLLHCSWTISWR